MILLTAVTWEKCLWSTNTTLWCWASFHCAGRCIITTSVFSTLCTCTWRLLDWGVIGLIRWLARVRILSNLFSTVKNLALHDRQTKLDNLSSWEIGISRSLVILTARLHFTLSSLNKTIQWERSTTEEQMRHFAMVSAARTIPRLKFALLRAHVLDIVLRPHPRGWGLGTRSLDTSSVPRFH